ncbi:hypothetical protein O181_063091 [Austropuccinia psidii MF-1]|uniref:Uncharacterized protein n=1 Tax=Austropuccinia psidii MF-1 TaxID=1389203 RepID=A0A9Q3HZ38_9BASI|nr:hypothetical protein [Austropuccinia psidii MF-1]
MLKLPPHPHDMPPTLQHHVLPHPSLNMHTPTTYHAYAPAVPSRYASDAGTPCPPSPYLLFCLPCLRSCIILIGHGGLLGYMMNAITEIC